MIPAFEPSGNLPPGIHAAAWVEVVDRLGFTLCRRCLLRKMHPAVVAFHLAGCRRLFLAGSFASAKPCPGDIDVLWDPEGVDVERLKGSASLLADPSPPARRLQRQRFGAEFIPVNLPRAADSFLDFFQTEKQTDRPRGIIQLDLAF